MRVHILDDWYDTLRRLPSFERLQGHEVTVHTSPHQGADLVAALDGAEAVTLLRERTMVDAALLRQLPDLRLISGRGNWPHVDVAACTANGVLFCSHRPAATPNHSAVELNWALIFAAYRQLPQQIASARAGRWQAAVGRSVHGKVLGLFGFGKIAREMATQARAFGMEVLVWGSDASRARAATAGCRIATNQRALFAGSDILSLQLGLNADTRAIVTLDDLLAMKPDALLVNTARAGLIAPGALLNALNTGRPGMAALDVFEHEPVTDPADPVLSHPHVLATPHIGFVTEDEFDQQFADIYDQINAYASGAPIHMVNPEVWRG